MEHIAMARRTGQGNLLAKPRALSCIGNRVVGHQSLRLGVQQMHTPGVAVAVRFTRQHVAIRRRGVHAGQYRLRALEDLVVRADPHGRQLDAGVDVARPAGRRFENPVNGAHAYRPAHHITHELDHTSVRAATHQRQAKNHLLHHLLRDPQIEQNRVVIIGRCRKRRVQRCASAMRLGVHELAAHADLTSQLRDRLQSPQRPNGQRSALTFGQPRCRTTGSIHGHHHA